MADHTNDQGELLITDAEIAVLNGARAVLSAIKTRNIMRATGAMAGAAEHLVFDVLVQVNHIDGQGSLAEQQLHPMRTAGEVS